MAGKSKKQNATQTANQTPSEAHQKRLDHLQSSLEDVCNRLADKSRSYTVRAIRARSVDPKVVEAGFREMESCIKRGREAYAAAQREDEVAVVARVDLRTL